MELNQIVYLSFAALVFGAFSVYSDSKQRNEKGEWSGRLQWGYLLMMIGIFGILAVGIQWSMTAVLLLFTVFTGAVWLWRRLGGHGKTAPDANHFRDYTAGFFPIIAIVFLLRTFIAEPFNIPSSSMRPGLVKGDFVLVSKFAYGIRIPVLNTVLVPTGSVARGDVAVFNYPVDPKQNFIKRIVGLPGDTVEYKDKVLTVNGKVEQDTPDGSYRYPDDTDPSVSRSAEQFAAAFDGRRFAVLKEPSAPAVSLPALEAYHLKFAETGYQSGLAEHCTYAPDNSGFTCTVPEGKYFAMGDNRDSSADSRYWGFVDDKLIVGKAFFVWMNVGDRSRIGNTIR